MDVTFFEDMSYYISSDTALQGEHSYFEELYHGEGETCHSVEVTDSVEATDTSEVQGQEDDRQAPPDNSGIIAPEIQSQTLKAFLLKALLPLLPCLMLLIPLTHVSLVQKIFHLRLVILLGLILVMLIVDNMCYQIGLLGVNQQKHMNLPFKPKLNILWQILCLPRDCLSHMNHL